jgi:hypothetical protein
VAVKSGWCVAILHNAIYNYKRLSLKDSLFGFCIIKLLRYVTLLWVSFYVVAFGCEQLFEVVRNEKTGFYVVGII